MIEWLPKENKLDNQQMSIIQKILTSTGNHFITGYPGTGKSVVLAWAALNASGNNSILTYTNALVNCIKTGILGAASAKKPNVQTIDSFIKSEVEQDVLFVDEAQDLSQKNHSLPTLAGRCKKIVFAADSEQSIYKETISLEEIKQYFDISSENVHHLDINYRMTKEMLDVVKVFFPYRTIKIESGRLNTDVEISRGITHRPTEGYRWIFEKAKSMFRPGRPAVVLFQFHLELIEFIKVVAPMEGARSTLMGLLHETLSALPDLLKDRQKWRETRAAWGEVNTKLSQLNIPIRFLGNGAGSLADADEQGLLYVMTCHSAKGLDFETVFVPDCERFEKEDSLVKNLFYVALTRARRNLFLLGSSSAQIHTKLTSCDFVRQVDVNVDALRQEEEDEDLF